MSDRGSETEAKESTEQEKKEAEKESRIEPDDDDNVDNEKEVLDDIESLLNDEEFIQSLNVVDAWEGEDESKKETQRNQDDHRGSKKSESKRREQKSSQGQEKSKKDDKKFEMTRRDPSKSNKDIERDKIRAKRNTESKILAEKEKAIKKILDSDNVVPPGTEVEALETIDKQNQENQETRHTKIKDKEKDKERQKVSPLKKKTSHKSRNRRSPSNPAERRRSPLVSSSNRHRSPFGSERRRRGSLERLSPDARRSLERHRRRLNEVRERDLKFFSRRSRSIERRRSRSLERRRRYSRSPVDRSRDRWRSRTHSQERRARKRSPFINEIARQLNKDALLPTPDSSQFMHTVPSTGLPPLLPPLLQPGGNQYMAPGHMMQVAAPFIPFESVPNMQPMNYNPVPGLPLPQMEFSTGPVLYNQPISGMPQLGQHPGMIPAPTPSPKPVPPPMQASYSHSRGMNHSPPLQVAENEGRHNLHSGSGYDEYRSSTSRKRDTPLREERLKTPEPPVISDTKLFEKTSLSSLLEASVSAKDSTGPPVLYPGFKPEVLQLCEHALQNLPKEDPRLKMKGRFFFDSSKREKSDSRRRVSNSVLLLKGQNKIHWDEDEQPVTLKPKQLGSTCQKICQTDEREIISRACQTTVEMVSIGIQVHPQDLQVREEKRPIADRLDWNVPHPERENFDYALKQRHAETDLRESLNSQRRTMPMWNGPTPSPPRGSNYNSQVSAADFRSRDYDEPAAFREPMPTQFEARYERAHFSSSAYPGAIDEAHYRGERSVPERILLEPVEPEILMRPEVEWETRGNAMGGKLGNLYKVRGGRPFRGGHGNFGGTSY